MRATPNGPYAVSRAGARLAPMLLRAVVDAASAVASTRSRLAKVSVLAKLLRQLQPDEIAPTVGFLAGRARQGRVGVGGAGSPR